MRKILSAFLMALLLLFSSLFAQKSRQTCLPDKMVAPRIIRSLPGSLVLHKPAFHDLFFESFESSTFPPAGWARLSFGNANQQWTHLAAKARTGEYCAAIPYCSNTKTMNEWLITPAIVLGTSVPATLRFWEDADYWPGYGKLHEIKISTTEQTTISAFQSLSLMRPNNHTINGFDGPPVEINLSNFMGDTVYIAFVYSGSDADNWYIDDVMVQEAEDHDLAVQTLKLSSHYEPGAAVAPRVEVKNVGLQSESFSVAFGYYDWHVNPVIIETKQIANLNVSETQSVDFSSFTPDQNSEKIYFTAIDYSADMDSRNDTATVVMNTFSHEIGKVLVEKGTGTWCGYCPGSALAIDQLYRRNSEKLAVLEYHSGDSFATDQTNYRLNYYRVTGFPTAIFNGIRWQVGGTAANGDWQSVFHKQNALFDESLHDSTGIQLALQLTDSNGQFTATATITYLAQTLLKTYRLFFALNESHISYSWKGLDSLQFVAREIYPNSNGINLYDGGTAPTAGTQVTHSVDFTIPPQYVGDNCQLIAFVQEMNSQKIAAVEKVDLNSVTGIAVVKNQMPDEFRLQPNYPNPFNSGTAIRYQIPTLSETQLQIFNSTGQLIRTLVSQKQKPGAHTIYWDGKDDSGNEAATGIYMCRMRAGQFAKTIKLILMK
ncbi:MAG: T9SS type A sorting domain-containing protein [Calditrichaeota bacterium]|nr:T9SS type A sorting domain-containing protein [Calditrichota bacterium]